jgi:hypothetical protein
VVDLTGGTVYVNHPTRAALPAASLRATARAHDQAAAALLQAATMHLKAAAALDRKQGAEARPCRRK